MSSGGYSEEMPEDIPGEIYGGIPKEISREKNFWKIADWISEFLEEP